SIRRSHLRRLRATKSWTVFLARCQHRPTGGGTPRKGSSYRPSPTRTSVELLLVGARFAGAVTDVNARQLRSAQLVATTNGRKAVPELDECSKALLAVVQRSLCPPTLGKLILRSPQLSTLQSDRKLVGSDTEDELVVRGREPVPRRARRYDALAADQDQCNARHPIAGRTWNRRHA